MRTTSMVMLIIIFAAIFSHVIALIGAPKALLGTVIALGLPKWALFTVVFFAFPDLALWLPAHMMAGRR